MDYGKTDVILGHARGEIIVSAIDNLNIDFHGGCEIDVTTSDNYYRKYNFLLNLSRFRLELKANCVFWSSLLLKVTSTCLYVIDEYLHIFQLTSTFFLFRTFLSL